MEALRRAAATLLVALAGGSAAASPIVGGSAAGSNDFPAVVAVRAGSELCSGSLVDASWVVTAAHCLDPDELHLDSQDAVTAVTHVLLGTVDVTGEVAARIDPDATYIDDAWDADHFGRHDLALIHLATPYTGAAPLPLNLDAARAPIGVTVTMAGFGTISSTATSGGVLYAVGGQVSESCAEIPVADDDTTHDDADLLCFSQATGQGTCLGDSGGPLLAMLDGALTIVGVTSFGDTTCQIYGAYTRTDAEGPFLAERAPELCGSAGCPPGPDDDDAGGGCCDAGGRGAPTALLGLLLVSAVARRRAGRRTCRTRGSRTAASPAGG